jgi:hypothetical protein
METLRRIVHLIFRPAAEWELIARENTSVPALFRNCILPLALLAPIATVIGMKVFDREWDPVHGYLVPAERIVATGATTFFAIVGSIVVLAAIFACIAPLYGGARDYRATVKLAAYGAVPAMLAGVTLLLPVMSIAVLAGLCHTLYLYWLGAGRVLNVADDGRAEFVAISIVLLTFVSIAAGAAASAIGLL